MPRWRSQVHEQLELGGREQHRLPRPAHLAAEQVHLDVLHPQRGGRALRGAAQLRAHPRQQLRQREGLDQVVHRACVQTRRRGPPSRLWRSARSPAASAWRRAARRAPPCRRGPGASGRARPRRSSPATRGAPPPPRRARPGPRSPRPPCHAARSRRSPARPRPAGSTVAPLPAVGPPALGGSVERCTQRQDRGHRYGARRGGRDSMSSLIERPRGSWRPRRRWPMLPPRVLTSSTRPLMEPLTCPLVRACATREH